MSRAATPIYVESHINASIKDIWAHTQEPAVHQRWDVRFTQIDYLDAPADGSPQQFVYATQVLPGLSVGGCGETLGERHRTDGTAYSGLSFWSDHPLSLIKEGSGYWRYVPAENGGTRFLTRYDYRVRWGRVGRIIDRHIFRPLFGWGTAWSFDRLRLWLEKGITPEKSLRRALTHATAVSSFACLVIYQGLAANLDMQGGLSLWVLALVLGCLATVVLATRTDLPSGRRPLRAPAQSTPTHSTSNRCTPTHSTPPDSTSAKTTQKKETLV